MRPPYLDDGDVRLYLGDCVEVMREMEPESIDAVVCDPPYGLEFMGKEWDRLGATVEHPDDGEGPCWRPARVRYGVNAISAQKWHEEWAREALRVLKPGGHLLAFGGTRTFHRLTCAVEDAGFEIRDCISWNYGSGFPKSLDVSKAIDKAAGAEREVVGINEDYLRRKPNGMLTPGSTAYGYSQRQHETDAQITAPATDDARRWQGWGTALKPAWEPCIVARKPLAGTVAANVLAHGTGAINVDGCRIGTTEAEREWMRATSHPGGTKAGNAGGVINFGDRPGGFEPNASGRWPANVALDEEAAAMLDEQSGERPSRFFKVVTWTEEDGCADASSAAASSSPPSGHGGSAPSGAATSDSRAGSESAQGSFSPCLGSTPSPSGSTQTLSHAHGAAPQESTGTTPTTHAPSQLNGSATGATPGSTVGAGGASVVDPLWSTSGSSRLFYTAKASTSERDGTRHPTVKPLALMRWLVRLVTPPGGVVLDPFSGSGTTLLAARNEGFQAIGIEREPDYARDIAHRLRQLSLLGEAS